MLHEQPTQPAAASSDRVRLSIGAALNIYSVLLAVVPVIVVVLVASSLFGQQAEDQAINQMTTIAESRRQEINRWLENAQIRLNVILASSLQVRDMRAIVDNPLIIPPLNDSVRVFLQSQLSVEGPFESLFLYDLRGRVRLSTDFDSPIADDVSALPFYAASLTEPHIQPPYLNTATGTLQFIITEPIYRTDESTDVIGVLGARLSIDALATILAPDESLSDTGETYLVSRATGGALTPPRFIAFDPTLPLTSEGITRALRASDGASLYTDYRDVPVIGVYRWLPRLDAALLAEIEEEEALAAVNAVQRASLTIAIVAALVALLIGRFVTRWLTRPIQRLTRVARGVMRGDFSQRANLKVVTEIGQLGRAFDTMTDNLVQTINERNARIVEIERLSATLESRVTDRTRDLRLAADVSRQITTTLNINQLLQQVVRLTMEGFALHRCLVYRLDQASRQLIRAAGADASGQLMPAGAVLPLDSNSSAAEALIMRRTIIIGDIDAGTPTSSNGSSGDARSFMSIPLIQGDTVLGVFEVQSTEVDRFGEDDYAVLNSIAEQTAIAMRNAQLFSEAQEARSEAEEANRVKSQFLANMSHELRTPLNAILNFAEFISDGDLGPVTDEQVDALGKVIGSGEHLLSLINDVLDITKIEVGLLELFVEEVDLNASLQTIIATGKGLIKDRPITLEVDIERDLPLIRGDRRRLHQVFLNLLSNAVKFTPQGTIVISARREAEHIHISVADTGVGIALEEQETVFESFRQAEYGRKTGIGTGLGLPISKHFVEAHGGRIWLESALNKGSTFHVVLPLETTISQYPKAYQEE
ncbi:MAG: ATP-binding protein [Chloroflexota bacterium]